MSLPGPTGPSASLAASLAPPVGPALGRRDGLLRAALARVRRPELFALIATAGLLNLWALSRNGWANTYYSAAVRSMSSSWHDFLFASFDPSGVMTVDKPPLALWVQALSARVFGYHPLSLLVPRALEGVAAVVLVYDLVHRRFGRAGGFVAGLALALTPITVAISRHNNPDALLVLCCVAAVWCAVRALEDGRAGWLVLSGVCVGLGFETKMGVALAVVPGIAAAWLFVAPRGRRRAVGQLLLAGGAMTLVGGAWPALVELTPASSRPWISGTSDNSVLSLIFGYNGLGRVDGQAGGPGRGGPGGGALFGGSPGPFRLVESALGGQAGWLLGFAVVAGLGLLLATRLRRSDPRSGWLIVTGGAFLTTAVLFSAASGIFHPYYVSLLAPFTAVLVGAGAAELLAGQNKPRILGPLAVVASVVVELVVLGNYPGQLGWLVPALIAAGALGALILALAASHAIRRAALAACAVLLLVAPAAWAIDTLGYATSATFPAGGPQSAQTGAGPRGGFGAGFARGEARRRLFARPGAPSGALIGPEVPPSSGAPARLGAPPPGAGPETAAPLFAGPGPGGPAGAGALAGGPFAGGPFAGSGSLTEALSYIARHGGGTLAVSSQSSAASAIIAGSTDVAAIGGFSGRESSVSTAWLAQQVAAGHIRWVLGEGSGPQGAGPRLAGDTRAGSQTAMAAVASVCRAVALPQGETAGGASGALYDCQGRAASLRAARVA